MSKETTQPKDTEKHKTRQKGKDNKRNDSKKAETAISTTKKVSKESKIQQKSTNDSMMKVIMVMTTILTALIILCLALSHFLTTLPSPTEEKEQKGIGHTVSKNWKDPDLASFISRELSTLTYTACKKAVTLFMEAVVSTQSTGAD
eukprot:TRINITY_DN10151_c0_g1_i2.p1 TRINITY_DN10151_c0_g1~~TRINITY_DN10151_c0_g1_i2.p1  ORF type:complete len:146 (+),score=39.36 TRINITY_DN10151_c0_g1_i2:79-516(+)